jgi:hypothetical protein
MFVRALQYMEFPGPIYPINPKAQEVLGLRCYPSLLEVPGPVDHVISSIPASGVLELMNHAAAKAVRSVHFFTAGFRETGGKAVTWNRNCAERTRRASNHQAELHEPAQRPESPSTAIASKATAWLCLSERPQRGKADLLCHLRRPLNKVVTTNAVDWTKRAWSTAGSENSTSPPTSRV